MSEWDGCQKFADDPWGFFLNDVKQAYGPDVMTLRGKIETITYLKEGGTILVAVDSLTDPCLVPGAPIGLVMFDADSPMPPAKIKEAREYAKRVAGDKAGKQYGDGRVVATSSEVRAMKREKD
jgi:hypothetical protein